MRVKIGLVQFESESSFEKNKVKAERFVKWAKERGADVVVFPENFISSSLVGGDFVDDKKELKKYFQVLAKRYSVDLVPGSVIEKNWLGKKYNVSYYINFDGRVLGRYKKVHLWSPEKSSIKPGNKSLVVNSRFGKVGLIICWDLIFPEVFRKMGRRGAKIVVCASHWSIEDAGRGMGYDRKSEEKLIDSACVDRAFENEIIFAYCNSAGKVRTKRGFEHCVGHSQVTEPFRGVVKKLNHNREKLIVVEVDTDILKDAEKSYKIKKDLKNNLSC